MTSTPRLTPHGLWFPVDVCAASRNLDEYANKLLSAMRKEFGGHDEKKA